MIALSNAMYINLGLQINDKAEKICILGNTIGFFGAVVNNKLSLSDSNPDTISNNLCWLINECRKNSEIMIIGNADIYKYYKIIFKWIGDSLQKRINWSSVNITKIIKNLSNFEEFEDNVDRSYIKVLEELYNKKLKFTKIIMNPPYDGNFHLKLVSTAMRLSDDIINLSPIRWLQDPLAEYKKNSDWNKFEDIREKIASIKEISGEEATKLFGADFYSSLGIYYFDGKKHDAFKYEFNPLIYKIINYPCKHFTYDAPEDKPYKIVLPATHGHLGKYDWAEITSKEWGIAKNVQASSETNEYVIMAFDTESEMKNFYDSLFLKLYKWLVKNIKTTAATAQYIKFVPMLPDYTYKWTDEMLYDFFGLTPEERDEIDKDIDC